MSSPEPVEFQRLFCVLSGEEDGSAFYHKNYAAHFKPILDPVKHILASAADEIPFNANNEGTFAFADYGCADGGFSVPVIQHVIDHIRQKQKPMPDIHIMYEDQPHNDFKSLFLMANGLTEAEYDSAWSCQKNVYFSATGRSFYEQCFPCKSVHVGISSQAVMYLSTKPCLLPDVLLYNLSTDEKKRALFAAQGASDWETFLLHRCRELVPGGILFVIAFYTSEDGQHMGATAGGKNLLQTMHAIWTQLYQEGKITKDELEEPTLYYYINTVKEFKAPFLNKDSTVYREGLRLVSLETKINPCFYQEKIKKFGTNDPEIVADLAHEFVMSKRAWGSGIFLEALSTRPDRERREIVDELFRRLEAQVRAEPTLHKEDLPVAYIMTRKMSE